MKPQPKSLLAQLNLPLLDPTPLALPPEPPGEQDGEGDFVQLDPPPVGFPIHPEVLGKASALLLRNVEVDQCSQGSDTISGGQHRVRAVNHIPGPYQVVTTLI